MSEGQLHNLTPSLTDARIEMRGCNAHQVMDCCRRNGTNRPRNQRELNSWDLGNVASIEQG